ncbi:hypothetical protein GE061_017365 [Apolygus lucorum]|uniref:Peptidase S1 domain-containing protein n=1 Tax=Apolygus lucorum TaxID=248454 RepID=A0A8S9XAN4_APOLU|nr:hypothetical protein GE061_017365 [Apolygus lucorum]
MYATTCQLRMLCLRSLLLLVLSLQFVTSNKDIGARRRRIINGEDLRDYSGYLVTNYFTWISNTHFCGTFDSFGSFFTNVKSIFVDYSEKGYWECYANSQNLKCGGALLTPKIVQTACHCVGAGVGTIVDGVERYKAHDPFADMITVFSGFTSTDDMYKGYTSQLFIIHERCSEKHGIILFDFGLIGLKTSIDTAFNPIKLAPLYSEKTLNRIWADVNVKEPTCLFVGFGRFVSIDSLTKPVSMQHTWKVLQNYRRCYSWTTINRYGFNYTTDGTWSCFLHVHDTNSIVYKGDSGSPVTCNNEYVGVNSATILNFKIPIHPKLHYDPKGSLPL